MASRVAVEADIPLILTLLASTPNPPLEDHDSIEAILNTPGEFTFIDTAVPVLIRMSPQPDNTDDNGDPAPEVPTPWYVWEGAFDSAKHYPIVGVVARAVKAALPRSGPWPAYGDLSGEGEDDAEKLADSERQAKELQDSGITGVTTEVSSRNSGMWSSRSTIDDIISSISLAVVVP